MTVSVKIPLQEDEKIHHISFVSIFRMLLQVFVLFCFIVDDNDD